ncbi:anacyclamide/piricyclamide family prenylated cyclic peptide [Nostoc sp. UHCC 0702]|nr:anacyclamide/piricyclamide family prenylated cyclic peptide [Nostoc sp. UHCC 0702]
MKKRNLRPQQAAPVARETNTNSSLERGIGAQLQIPNYAPFAGDDAE